MSGILEQFLGNILKNKPAIAAPVAPQTDPLHDLLTGVQQKAQANAAALAPKTPFLANVVDEGVGAVKNVAEAAGSALQSGVRGFLDLTQEHGKVTPAQAAMKTISGVGKLAQGFNESVIQLGKSAASALPGGKAPIDNAYATPGLRAFLGSVAGQEDIPTIQDFYEKSVEHAKTIGATPAQAKVYGGAMAVGLGLMDNPLFGAEGQGLKLTSEATRAIAATDDVAKITSHLIAAGVDAETAGKIAPAFKNADTPKLVQKAAAEIQHGVQNAKAVVEDQPVLHPETGEMENSPAFKERGFVTSVKEQIPELETRVAGQYLPRDTDKLSLEAATRVADNPVEAEAFARAGSDDKAIATAVQLVRHYSEQGRAATDEAAKGAFYDKAATIANDTAVKLTEQGRAIQAASILSRLEPETQVRVAARKINEFREKNPGKGRGPLTGEEAGKIDQLFKDANEAEPGIDQAKKFQDAFEYVDSLVPTPFYKKAVAVWKAGLLTGLKTFGVNIASNLSHAITELAKDVPAAAVDKFASLFTGKRTLALTTRGTLKGGSEGVRKGWNYFKTGYDERYAGLKTDLGRVNFGDSKVAKAIQAYEETVFRAIGAEDQPFYYSAKAHSLYSQAIAEAKNQGLKGKDAEAFIQKAIEAPTDDMLVNATHDAEVAVFQNNTALGTAARAIQQDVPGGEVIVPFGRTPAALATQVFHYSPGGIVAEIAKQIKAGRFSQRAFSQAAGRGITGTAAMYLGYQLWKHGKVSLGYPTDPSEQQEWKNEGRQENSIKIGGKWRQIGVLGPVGTSLVIGGYLADGVDKMGSIVKGMEAATLGGMTTLEQSTFLSGLSDFIDAVKDPQRSAGSLFTGLIGSLVPTIVGDVARATDPYERNTSLGGGTLNRVQARIPGLREKLQPTTDTLGNKTKTPDWLTVLADPTRPTTENNDATVQEMARLQHAGHNVADTFVGDKGGYTGLTPAQNTELRLGIGTLLKGKLDNLVSNPSYQKMDDDAKAKMIQAFNTKSDDLGRALYAIKLTQGMQGGELSAELKKLVASGMLTKTVYGLYQGLR